jgi:hypothetical protein
MERELELYAGTTPVTRRKLPHGLWAHPFVTVLVVGALVGGGLRFVPAGAASSGSSGPGQTACAAK